MAIQTPTLPDNPLLTVQQVAKLLQVDDTTVRRWIKGGVLAAIILPRANPGVRNTYRVEPEALEAVLLRMGNAAKG